ncbi:MAG: M16 family metallopeptidase [Clostridia bacterium]|jgi:predicted Zn-dependent peptidase|nr:insulinase family protein [Clostridiaceae bacterium]
MNGKITLKNGLRIVYEKMPYVRSISTGIWVGAGSRYERDNERGISHLIEHMLFKGTERRTGKQIAEEIDNIGGQINAFTGKEMTCYYTKTLDNHFETSLDLLSDMLFNSKFRKEDLDVEKNVVLEEINLYNDSPEELIHDVIQQTVWPEGALGMPVLGTPEVLKAIGEAEIRDYMSRMYYPENCVIAVAGNIDEKALAEQVEKYFGNWPKTDSQKPCCDETVFTPVENKIKKDTEQVHFCVAYKSVPAGTKEVYPVMLINNVVGGGMSSRLFQKIREEYGLVYTIYSYPVFYNKEGLFVIYAGMNPGSLKQVIDLMDAEIAEFVKNEMDEDALSKAKEQLKGGYLLSQESTGARMNAIGKSELLYGNVRTKEEITEEIMAITKEDVAKFTELLFKDKERGFAFIGKI